MIIFVGNYAIKIIFATNNSIRMTIMAYNPSYNGIGPSNKTVLRTTKKETETTVSTQNPHPSTPSPRGHA